MAPASLPSPVPASGAGVCEPLNNDSSLSSNGDSEEWLLVKSAGKGYKGSKGSKVSETRASPSLNHDNMQQPQQKQTHANGVGSKQQQQQQHQSSSGSSASTPPSSSANATAAATTTTTTTTTTAAVTRHYNHQKTTTPPPQPPAAAASPPARRDSSEERQRRQDSFKRKGKAAMSDTGGDHQSTPNGANGQTSIHQTPGHRRGNSSGAIQLVSPPPSPKAAEVLATLTSPSITAPLARRPMAVYDSDDDETVSNRSGGASSSGASLAGLTYNNHSSSQHLPAAGAPAAVTSDEGGPSYYDLTQVPVDIDELSRLVGTLEKPHHQPKQRKKHSQQQQRQQQQQQQQQQHHHHQQQSTWEDMLHRLSDYLLIAYRCCDADFHAVLRKAVVEQAAFPLQLADKDVINLLENRVLKPPSHATPASPTSSSSPKSPTAVDDDDEAAHNAALEAVALRLLQAIVADGSVPSTIAPAPAPAGSLVPQMHGGSSAQASPRQTKVGYLVMFAALARRHPATVLSIASELASSVHFTGASRVPALVWAYAQAANGSRAAGLALWSRNLLPLLLTPVPSSSSSSSSSLASSPAPPLVRGCGSPAPHGVGPSPSSSSSSSKKKKKKEKGGSAAKSNAAADGGKSAATAPRPPPPSMDVHRKLAASFLSFVLSAKLPETPHTSFATTKPTATAAAAAAAAPVPASSLVQFLQVCHVPGRGGLEQSEAKRLGQLYPRLRAAALRLASKKGLGPHDSFAVGLLRAVLQAASEYADRASDAAAAAASDTPATPPRGGWFRKRSDPPQLASPDHKALSADPFIVELASLMQWCLEGDLVCYDEWRRLYIDHLLGSTLLLHAMANAADDVSSRGKRSTSANGKKAGGSMNSTASAALCDSMLRQVAHFDPESAPSTSVSERKRPRWAPAWLPFFGSTASSGAKAALSNQNAVGPLDHLQYTQEQWQAAAAAAERMRAALGVPRRQAKGSFQPYVVIAMVAVLVLISLIAGAVQVHADRLAWTSDAPYTIERGARVMCRELLSVVLPPRGSAGMCGVDVAPWLAALDGANEESAQATLGIV